MDSLYLPAFFVSSLLHIGDTPYALATIAAWPIHLATAAGGIAAMPSISWGYASAGIVVWLLTTAATWLVSARVTSAVLREQNSQLKDSLKNLITDVHALTSEIGALRDGMNESRAERGKCELRAVKTFASRDELTRVLVEVAAGNREVASRIDDLGNSFRHSVGRVHGRCDGLQDRLAGLEGRVSHQMPFRPALPEKYAPEGDSENMT